MKSKSNPVALLSVGGVLVLVLVVGGMTGAFTNPGRFFEKPPEPPKQAPQPTKESTDASKKNATAALRSARTSAVADRMGEVEDLVNGVPKESTLVIPEVKPVKPQINDSNISAQWYREESRQNQRAKEKEREREAAAGRP